MCRNRLCLVIWYFLTMLASLPSARAADEARSANVCLRDTLNNCRIQFEQQKKGHVAFIGGSITEMNGYRPMVCEILRRRFPATEFTFTDAGLSSTCSTTGAFRAQTDVFGKGPVDLFFVEFAVNDDQDAHHSRQACIRGMEGLVRQALRHNPNVDIVITHFINPEMMETLRAGRTPLTAGAHEEVAERYGISTINLAREVTERIVAGKLTWKEFGGVHPAPLGNAICAGMIDQLMERAWNRPLAADARKIPRPLPEPLDPLSYERGRFVELEQAKIAGGWRIETPDWKSIKGSTRKQFNAIPLLCAEGAGAEMSLEFSGTAVGVFVVAGPDAGIVVASIDGGPPVEANLYHRYSAGLHYPRTVMLATDLKAGQHTLTLRVSDKTTSAGHAVRIVKFVAN